MRLDIAPIISALRRHRITSVLLIMQIALTCAIVCNAVFLVADRLSWMDTPSGIDEDRIAAIRLSAPGKGVDVHARAETDMAVLRAVNGVEDVSTINSLPFNGRSWTTDVRLDLSEKVPFASMAQYYGERAAQLLGAQLQEGRWIRPDEYAWIDDVATKRVASSGVVMLTQPAAKHLFPGRSAIGQTIYMGDDGYRVVGIVRRLASAGGDRATIGEAILTPFRMVPTYGAGYVIRTAPGQAGSVLNAAAAALKKVDPRRVVTEKTTFSEIRRNFFAGDRALSAMLVGACVVLLAITALGIVGLASFWVAQRRRQIGVRRALGATRGDVLRYFQTENFLLASMGILLGMALAYAMNVVLMLHYEIPRLPWGYLPGAAILLWIVGQLAVLAPALRAASVSPVEATRG